MFSPDDTIVAIATPPGRAGLGVVRASGPDAGRIAAAILSLAAPLRPRYATFTTLRSTTDASGSRARSVGDEVVATFFPAPHSYTGQDVVEISAHGSPVVLQGVLERAIDQGARLAEPGEFTLRAFLNGKRDLVRAEAVADLVEAVTPLQARTAFDQLQGTLTTRIEQLDVVLYDVIARLEASIDFPDEGYHFIGTDTIAGAIDRIVESLDTLLRDADRGRIIREGAQVVIAGRPNVGKSSLFNALVGADRAIVTAIPGTTRDLVTERVDIGGLAITLVDTAGVRDTLDIVEREGVARGNRARDVADLVLVVIDASAPLTRDDLQLLERTADRLRLIVLNKIDALGGEAELPRDLPAPTIEASTKTAGGIDALRHGLVRALAGEESLTDSAAISNVRHIALLNAARRDLASARESAAAAMPEEFVLADLQAARHRFDEVVGRRTTDDLLAHIFERFCIGK